MSDTLRQTIADVIAAWDNHDWEDYDDIGGRILAAVLADPTVARWKNIAEAFDTEPLSTALALGHNMLLAKLRAAGQTT